MVPTDDEGDADLGLAAAKTSSRGFLPRPPDDGDIMGVASILAPSIGRLDDKDLSSPAVPV